MKNAKKCDKEKKEPMEVDPEKYPWRYSGGNITYMSPDFGLKSQGVSKGCQGQRVLEEKPIGT